MSIARHVVQAWPPLPQAVEVCPDKQVPVSSQQPEHVDGLQARTVDSQPPRTHVSVVLHTLH